MAGFDRRTFFKGAGAAAGTLGMQRLGSMGSRSSVAARQTTGGTLRVAFSDALTKDGLNPALAQDNFYIVPPQSTMYESLVKLDNAFQPNPHLAESWESSDDAQTWVFTLRDGVEFHDGSTMSADDVVYSLQMSMDPQSGTSREEMERRWAAVRAAMATREFSAVVATSYAASYYLSGPRFTALGGPWRP